MPTVPAPSGAAVAPTPFMVYVGAGFAAYGFLGSTDASPSAHFTVGDGLKLSQQIGVGYVLTRRFRLNLALVLGEAVTNRPVGVSPLSTVAVLPWLAYTPGRFFVGAGPMLGLRSGGVSDFHASLFTCVGYGFPLGRGFAFAVSVHVPMGFSPRLTVSIVPAISLARRF